MIDAVVMEYEKKFDLLFAVSLSDCCGHKWGIRSGRGQDNAVRAMVQKYGFDHDS